MKVTRTFELNDDERLIVDKFLSLTDSISGYAGCSMEDVFNYFRDAADPIDNKQYCIGSLHQLANIR